MRHARNAALVALMALLACRAAAGSGLMIPSEKTLPPLSIQSHRVSVSIRDGVARTHLTEVFRNSTDRRLEATYVFPVPRGAALTDFAMFVDGKRMGGEVVEAEKARRIYQDIVRRLRDPGLLEYMGSGLLRLRVFPIQPNSTVKVEVAYSHALPFDSGIYRYTFPLKTGSRASKVQQDFTVSVEVASRQPIKSVYCPTHQVGVTRKDDHHAVAGFEQTGAMLDRDFTLFYTVGREDFGLNLLAHRAGDEDGYFAVMISPSVELPEQKIMPKDVCFVLDTSGSMQEQNRIASARGAVKFCLNALDPRDRFALVRFSTSVEVFGEGLTEATPEAVRKAVAYTEKLQARGGTDLCGAVLKALQMAPGGDRPYLIVLVTDGKPTVGVTDTDQIVQKVKDADRGNVRVFTFGIAEDLNVALLDRIAEATRGYPEYVAPGREIEQKISSFFRKVSHPVLADLKLDFGSVKVTDLYPQQLPDLFRGSQLVVFGRYSGGGDVAVRLTGRMAGKERTFTYDASFPKQESGNEFITQLWARRKIGYLLDQIRLHGKTQELVDEVVRLSKTYGIATPYTSYLVLEDEKAYREHGIVSGRAIESLRRSGVAAPLVAPAPGSEALKSRLAEERMMLDAGGQAATQAPAGKAVDFGRALRRWKAVETVSEASSRAGAARLVRVGSRTFLLVGGAYVDTAYQEKMDTLRIKWGSDAFFAALDAMPELKDCLALGERVVIVVKGKALIVSDEGREKMSAGEIRAFFAK